MSNRRRLTRRSMITDFGAAGLGVIVFGACAGSSESSPGTTGASTDDTTAPDATDGDTTGPSGGELRLERVSLGFVSAYVLVRGNEAAVVDTGTADSSGAILDGLSALSVAPGDVSHIVLTHNHGDHIGGLSGLEADLANATVHAGAGDIGSIQTSLTLAEVADGDEVFGMGVIATPGHTPGSISLFDTESGILVAGDAVGGTGDGGLNGSNPDFTADMAAAEASIAKLAALMPRVVAFGHGGDPVSDEAASKLSALA